MLGEISPRRSASARAVDAGHHHVGQQQVDARRVPRADTGRLRRILDREHLVAVGLQHQPHELAHAGVVLDDHDRLRAAARPRVAAVGLGVGARARGDRQVDLERRAAPGLAVDVDPAAALLDHAEHGREPEPGALAGGLGRVERLEQVAADLLVHADARVADRQQDVRAGRALAVLGDLRRLELDVGGLDRQRAAVGHRVARVGGEVEDHALHLRAVGLDRREPVAELDRDADVVADDALQHPLHAGDDLVEVDHARVQHLAAAEREKLAGERRRLPGGAGDLLQLLVLAPAAQQDLGVAADHGQQVVEVMRDAAGEPADGLHLLRLAEPALERDLLAHVVREHERRAASVELDPAGGDLDVEQPAVLGLVTPGAGAKRAEAVAAGDAAQQRRDVLGRPDVLDRHRQELLARPAVLADRRVVDGQEAQRVGLVDPHRQRAGLEQHPIPRRDALGLDRRGRAPRELGRQLELVAAVGADRREQRDRAEHALGRGQRDGQHRRQRERLELGEPFRVAAGGGEQDVVGDALQKLRLSGAHDDRRRVRGVRIEREVPRLGDLAGQRAALVDEVDRAP